MFKKNIFIVIILLFISIPQNIFCESISDITDTQLIDEFIRAQMKELSIPGVSIGIVKNDTVVYVKGYGVADSRGHAMTPQTPIKIGSVSKTITAVAILQLTEQGKIALDEPVKKYIPWFRLKDASISNQITIRHLLTHTSGISTYSGVEICDGNAKRTIEQTVRGLSKISVTQPIGENFEYSNANYVILGEVIQLVSGLSYEEYIDKNIFTPLDMKHSYAGQDKVEKGLPAYGYQPILGIMLPTYPSYPQSLEPAGYVYSSAEDMTHLLIAHMNNGKYNNTTILSQDSITQMHNPTNTPYYGLGWMYSRILSGHDGFTENSYCNFFIAETEGWGVVTLTNSNDTFDNGVLNKHSYTNLATGIISILKGNKNVQSNTYSTKYVYLGIDLFLIIILLLIILSLYFTFKKVKKASMGLLSRVFRVASLLVVNIFLPLLIIIFKPLLPEGTWKSFFLFIPGISHAILLISIMLLVIGVLKTVLFLVGIRNSRQKLDKGLRPFITGKP